jgi:hypothetical protein
MDTSVTVTFDMLNLGSGRKTGEVTAVVNKRYVAHCVRQARKQNENKVSVGKALGKSATICLAFWSSEMLPCAAGNVIYPAVWK